jgi:hypothetical protein
VNPDAILRGLSGAAAQCAVGKSSSSGLAMPVLPGNVGSSLTDEPIAERIVPMPTRGAAVPLPEFAEFIDTMRSCADDDWVNASTPLARGL